MRNHHSVVRFLILTLLLALVAAWGNAQPKDDGKPRINERLPIKSADELSPPIVAKPIHECARAVHVSGFIPHAIVKVYANGTEQIGQASPYFGFADIPVKRDLHLGDKISATQTVGSLTSAQSYDPVMVGPYPVLDKPDVDKDLFDCGHVVPVDKLISSVRVLVFANGTTQIGQAEAPNERQPIVTAELKKGQLITAEQVACPDNRTKKVVSPRSDPVKVKPAPDPMPSPVVEAAYVGNDAVTLHGLFVGAEVHVFQGGTEITKGLAWANASRNWAPVSAPVKAAPQVTATQKLCVMSKPSEPVTPTDRLPPPIIVAPICEGTHYVTIQNTVINANVVLFRNGAIAGYGGAVPGDLVLALGGGKKWNLGDAVTTVQYTGTTISPVSETVIVDCNPAAVVTQHNDNNRSGAYLHEKVLTTSNVNAKQFGKLFSRPVDGQIYAQPLYVPGVKIPGKGMHNVVYVATEHNSVYAFDGDNPTVSSPLWHKNLGPSMPSSDLDKTPPKPWTARNCTSLAPEVGITSAPVIDLVSATLYVVAKTKESGKYFQRLHALDITTGLEKFKGPVLIQGVVSGKGAGSKDNKITFDPFLQLNRPGLLLHKGVVYLAFGGHCDLAPWHGWVFAYDAKTLKQRGLYNSTPNGGGGGIWQSGQGLAADSSGIYLMTGNGPFDVDKGGSDFGDSFVKLTLNSSPAGLVIADWFTPFNQAALEAGDGDLGSAGPLLLPDRHLMVGGGKEGKLYLLDRNKMGHFQAGSDSQIVQSFPATAGHIHGSPVYWQSLGGLLVYVWGEMDNLKAFKMVGGLFNPTTAVSQSNVPLLKCVDGFCMPGGMLSVSANEDIPGTGIVWASYPEEDATWKTVKGILYAFDAADVSKKLWSSKTNAPRDDLGTFAKFCPPTVANGKVYMATFSNELVVYGLLHP